MEAHSARGHRGRVPWLLLAVSLSTYWIPSSSGGVISQAMQISDPINTDAIFHIMNTNTDNIYYAWMKSNLTNVNNNIPSYIVHRINTGQQLSGPAYNGRQVVRSDGALMIKNITKQDEGYYTFIALTSSYIFKKASSYVFILDIVAPTSVHESNYTVPENETVAIVCKTTEASHTTSWFFNNQRLHLNDRRKLSQDRTMLFIMPVKSEDAGQYHCKFTGRLSSKKTEYAMLEVV